MNHRTPIEDFRAALAALSREQLIEAMHYLRGYNSFAMDRALELVTMPVAVPVQDEEEPDSDLGPEAYKNHKPDCICWDCEAARAETIAPAVLPRVHVHLFGQDGICTLCDLDIVTWSQAQGDAELDHIAIEGTRS